MATVTPLLLDLLDVRFRTIADEEMFDRWDPIYTRVFNVESSSKAEEMHSEITGYGLIPVLGEHAPVTYDDPLQGFDVTFSHLKYGLGTDISEEMIEDDQHGKIAKLPRGLSISMKETVETDASNVFNRAFNSSYTGGDGEELCHTAHPKVAGGTFQNRPTNDADLSATSLEQAEIDLASTTDHRGKKIRLRIARLIHPTELNWTVARLFGSEKDPDSANNAINPARTRVGEFVEYPYLTDPDAWFLQCTMHGLTFYWRKRPSTMRDRDFATSGLRHKQTGRWSNGFIHPFGIYGTSGG
jgi:hypothetical protein